MKLIDSNIIIYSIYPDYAYLRKLLTDTTNLVSSISKVEVLGYPSLLPDEKQYFESIFKILQIVDVSPEIIEKAIEVRQKKKIKLGDAIIAATSLVTGADLYTRNIDDFRKISGVKVFDPIKE